MYSASDLEVTVLICGNNFSSYLEIFMQLNSTSSSFYITLICGREFVLQSKAL
jgi:hypothetical protein